MYDLNNLVHLEELVNAAGDRVARINGANAMTPTSPGITLYGRSSGVRTPAFGSRRGPRWLSPLPDAVRCVSAAHRRSPV